MKNSDNIKNTLPPQSQSSAVSQAVVWLKMSRSELIDELARQMGNSSALPVHWLPTFLRKAVAKDMIDDLITRLDESIFDQKAATEKMMTALKRGASAKSIEASIDLMLLVVTKEAQAELANQPILLKAVSDKTEYFATLIKACLASAIIEHQNPRTKEKR